MMINEASSRYYYYYRLNTSKIYPLQESIKKTIDVTIYIA